MWATIISISVLLTAIVTCVSEEKPYVVNVDDVTPKKLYEEISMKSQSSGNSYERPKRLYPVYLRIIQRVNQDDAKMRDILSFSIGTRQKRERTFTRFNSSLMLLQRNRFDSDSLEDERPIMPKPTIYNVTIFPKPLDTRPLILIRNFTKTESTSSKDKLSTKRTSGKIKVYLNSNNTRTAINSLISSKTNASLSSGEVESKGNTQDDIKTSVPPDPPTGDVTEEEDDDEEEEDDEADDDVSVEEQDSQGLDDENSSEEEEDDNASDEAIKLAATAAPATVPLTAAPTLAASPVVLNSAPTGTNGTLLSAAPASAQPAGAGSPAPAAVSPVAGSPAAVPPATGSPAAPAAAVPTKGDTGTITPYDNAKKKAAKKKKKKKKKKKADLHFIPKPLGAKAEIIIRLDKAYHNVKKFQSAVQGAFSDYIKRPHVNLEFSLRNEPLPHERYDLYNSPPPPWHPPTWRNAYVDERSQEEDDQLMTSIDQSVLSKRVLRDCDDDDEYEGNCEGSYNKPSNSKPHKPNKPSGFRVPLPYPIFLESRDEDSGEYSPFDYLPPLRPSSIRAPEKTWVKTWDKNKNGLPTVADSDEASVRVNSRPSRRKSSKNKNVS